MASDQDPSLGTENVADPGLTGAGDPGQVGGEIPSDPEGRPEVDEPKPPGVAQASSGAAAESPAIADSTQRSRGRKAPNMLPGRERRRLGLERLFVRLIATSGVVGIGVAIGAILASSKTQGWIIGLAVALVSVMCSAILWSSRQL